MADDLQKQRLLGYAQPLQLVHNRKGIDKLTHERCAPSQGILELESSARLSKLAVVQCERLI